MGNIVQSPYGADNNFFHHVTADSDRSVDWERKPQIFDSLLTKSFSPNTNFTLKIVMRMFLSQVPTNWGTDMYVRSVAVSQRRSLDPKARYGYHRDSNDRFAIVKGWTTSEWDQFLFAFDTQAAWWDRKFWIIPPDDFNLFDIKSGNSTVRPNIACEFDIAYVNASGNPHIKVQAANIHDPNEFFRSHMTLYSSEGRHLGETASMDPITGLVRSHFNYSTIAHEIGHAIGLPHIGVIRSRPQCKLAVVLNDLSLADKLGPLTAALYKGGTNSNVCYGSMSPNDDAENVMGMGSKFAVENASPWLERLPYHIRTPIDIKKWTISLSEVPPMSLVFK